MQRADSKAPFATCMMQKTVGIVHQASRLPPHCKAGAAGSGGKEPGLKGIRPDTDLQSQASQTDRCTLRADAAHNCTGRPSHGSRVLNRVVSCPGKPSATFHLQLSALATAHPARFSPPELTFLPAVQSAPSQTRHHA